MKSINTWILVADGARARVLLNTGRGDGLTEVPGFSFQAEHQPSGDMMADREGRSFESHGKGRHAMERPSDPHRNAKKVFAGTLAAMLDKQAVGNGYDRLVIVAPPQMLGDLRAALSPNVRDKVHAELGKDLTHVPDHDLMPHLADVLAG